MSQAASDRPADDAATQQLVDRLYGAFAECDGATMAACYGADARFSDPVFPDLRGTQVGAMWTMLTSRAQDLRLEVTGQDVRPGSATVNWTAHYTFTQTGRKVVNRVRSELRLGADGLVADQRDDFEFHRWSRQALGLPGALLGWTPVLRKSVQRRARAGLDEFIAGLG